MEDQFRDTFALLGRPLQSADAVSDRAIDTAEAALGCRVPEPLRAFYRVAGNARDMIDHHDNFLLPSDWSLEGGNLVFLTDDQAVVLYAVDSKDPEADPPVLMANNEEPYTWHQVCGRCSEFLHVMVHWEGAFGGAMPFAGSATVQETIREALETGFRARGEVNAMRAYSRPGLAVCFVEWDDDWRIFVGAANEDVLAEIANLGVSLELNA